MGEVARVCALVLSGTMVCVLFAYGAFLIALFSGHVEIAPGVRSLTSLSLAKPIVSVLLSTGLTMVSALAIVFGHIAIADRGMSRAISIVTTLVGYLCLALSIILVVAHGLHALYVTSLGGW